MRMMTARKAKYNWWQVGPTESESLIGLIILLPAFFGRDVYETPVFEGAQLKHVAAGAYLLVQALMIMDCVVETLMKDAAASLRFYLPMVPMQALFLVGCKTDSLGYLGDFAFYNLMFQVLFHLQYIHLTIEDLTGSSEASSRFPGYDYILSTVPFAVHHLLNAFPELGGSFS